MNSNEKFIQTIATLAKNGWKEYKILPSLTIAQAILESGWGKSDLTLKANNLFGIKAFSDWDGEVYKIKTLEYDENNNPFYETCNFKKYANWNDSILDHSKFLNKERYKNVIGETNYKIACNAVKEAGYATDPNYPNKLIKLIEEYNLYEFDNECLDFKENNSTSDLFQAHYKVKEKDTLNNIAKKYLLKLEDLIIYNNIEDENLIFIDQLLILPNTFTYEIQANDTLIEIANKYNTNILAIVKLNNISTIEQVKKLSEILIQKGVIL